MLFKDVAEAYEKIEGISSRLKTIDVLSEIFKKANENEIRQLVYFTQGMLAPPFTNIKFGIAEKFDEEAIARATDNRIEEIRKLYKKEGDLGIVAQKLIVRKKKWKQIKVRRSLQYIL